MNWKIKDIRGPTATTPSSKLSFSGGGKVSVSVNSIVNSPKVQRQVEVVKEIAASQGAVKQK